MTDLDALYEKMLTYASGPVERQKIVDEYERLKGLKVPISARPFFSPTEEANAVRYAFAFDDVTVLGSPDATWHAFRPLMTQPAKAPEPENPPLPEEYVVNALVGCRAWNVPLFVDELRSVARASKWLPYRRFEAKCEEEQCDGVTCTCGVYAFKKMALVQKEYTQPNRSKRYVYGECWLWGRVLECKRGYRAQFAYPKGFINNGAIAKRMAEVFGVELLSAPISE
jgi:hypothetical protein